MALNIKDRETEKLSVAWRAGAQGKALAWWIERLTDALALEGLLASARRLYASGASTSNR